jgi:hypothetical protein
MVKGVNMRTRLTILWAFVFLVRYVFGQGTVLWNESVDGSFSHDFSQATSLSPLHAGTNSVFGTTEVVPDGNIWIGYPDFFTITIPADMIVTAIYLQVDKPDVWAWIGNSSFSSETGFVMNPNTGELLEQWSLTSLGAGAYGMYMNNHDQQPFISVAQYRLDYVVQAVPEPNTLSIFLSGVGLLGLHRWRRS